MKNTSVEKRLLQMMSFHRRLRRLLQQPPVRRPAAEDAAESDTAEALPVQNPVYGRFSLDRRINVDQVGLAFVNDLESTWDETGAKRVQISQPFSGLEKRQCTVTACFGPGAKLMQPVVVSRGKGRVPAVKRAAYDPRVDGQRNEHRVAEEELATEPQRGGGCCAAGAVHPFRGQPSRADDGRV